ncbi:hypothetical protein [Paraburkholderia terrae]|uniref:hypothetical protein n=1 Tax=Paraburkholderia terrae TaxID=311230 RepID=UPI00205346F1|nr:hypothetical protein [Paraburkholderia terrae]BDC44769.1 hypothetical protein PTKU15_80660 [Paraburkholderia terrae]
MEKNIALQTVRSAHHTAQAIANSRPDLSETEQEALYDRVYLGLLEDSVGSMSIGELLDVLAER